MAECLDAVGIAFLFAPAMHSAMKYVQPARRELRLRTVFNLLGPLTNPAKASAQVVGVYAESLVSKLAEALKQFNDVALNVKLLDIQKDVMIEKFRALASVAGSADIKWILSGQNAQSFFGLNLNAEGGANLDQFMDESGIDLRKLTKAEVVKEKKADSSKN